MPTPHTLPKLHVCTVASEQKKSVNQLLKSCEENGITLEILGLGKPFRGYCEKFILVEEFVRALADTDIVMFIDAYDSLLLTSAEVIVETFLSMNASFVISSEKYCMPYAELQDQYPTSKTSFRYINTGCYIGYVDFIKKWLHDLHPFNPEDNDQGVVTKDYLKHKEKYLLDTSCRLFLSTVGIPSDALFIDRKRRSVVCLETKNSPCVLHGNSRSQWYPYTYECLFDDVYRRDKKNIPVEETKSIFLAIFASNAECVLIDYLSCIDRLMYNKKLITVSIFLYDSIDATEKMLKEWVKENKDFYNDILFEKSVLNRPGDPTLFTPERFVIPEPLYKKSILQALGSGVDYYFTSSVYNFITPFTLKELLSQEKPYIAPLLFPIPEQYDVSCNFIAPPDLSEDIIFHRKLGSFKVTHTFGTRLIAQKYLETKNEEIEEYISNQKRFGFMIYFSQPITEQQQENLQRFLSITKLWKHHGPYRD